MHVLASRGHFYSYYFMIIVVNCWLLHEFRSEVKADFTLCRGSCTNAKKVSFFA